MRFYRIVMTAAVSMLLSTLALTGCSSDSNNDDTDSDQGELGGEIRCDMHSDCPAGQECKWNALNGHIDICGPIDNTDYEAMDLNCTTKPPPGREHLYFTFNKHRRPDDGYTYYVYRGMWEDQKITGPNFVDMDSTKTFTADYPGREYTGPWFSVKVKPSSNRAKAFDGELKVLRADDRFYDAKLTCKWERPS